MDIGGRHIVQRPVEVTNGGMVESVTPDPLRIVRHALKIAPILGQERGYLSKGLSKKEKVESEWIKFIKILMRQSQTSMTVR
jgi:hypothetical protein